MPSYIHTHNVGDVVIMDGVDQILIIDALIPGIDIAQVRVLCGSNTALVRASGLILFDWLC